MSQYSINEIFYSLQGEGKRAGTANVFVRFAGCNLQCSVDNEAGFDCDTEFSSFTKFDVETLARYMRDICSGNKSVIFSGGEPSLQIDERLISTLKNDGWYIAIETNGTKKLPDGIDWITVSPKSAEHTLKQLTADEVKYVRFKGQGLPKPRCKATHQLISPAANADWTIPRDNLEYCIQLVKENPGWDLSVQQHKQWGVR